MWHRELQRWDLGTDFEPDNEPRQVGESSWCSYILKIRKLRYSGTAWQRVGSSQRNTSDALLTSGVRGDSWGGIKQVTTIPSGWCQLCRGTVLRFPTLSTSVLSLRQNAWGRPALGGRLRFQPTVMVALPWGARGEAVYFVPVGKQKERRC